MPPLTSCLVRTARTSCRCTRRRYVDARGYSATTSASTTPGDLEWFEKLRNEMLNRPAVSYRENVDVEADAKLANTLSTFLPAEWIRRRRPAGSLLPLSHSLVWFNTAMPVDQLLPDGTDPLQSPGEPWTRRMWAGGAMELNAQKYFDPEHGFKAGSDMICSERIQDVQLRGQGDAAKIFVTLHRRFASLGSLPASSDQQAFFEQQLLGADWGDAILTEERNLVFLKDKTAEEHEAVKAGQFMPVRYLDSPGNPDFSHTLTPTRALLFRYSALTFNAHLIHLDREYARTVEGHRNLLVHGPLSLTLMLNAIAGHVKVRTKNKRIVESIQYRNLAPLYCDEEMRLCGALKESRINGDVFDIWIEGPTGGVAVKGTVRTVQKPMFSVQKFVRHPNAKSSNKSPPREGPSRAAIHGPSEISMAKVPDRATSGVSETDVALGLDDSTAPSNPQRSKTSVRSRTSSVPNAVPNLKPRQTSPVMATGRHSADTEKLAPKFFRLVTPPGASGGDASPASSTANGRIEPKARPRRLGRREVEVTRRRILKVEIPRLRILKRRTSSSERSRERARRDKARPPQSGRGRVHSLITRHQQATFAPSYQQESVSLSSKRAAERPRRNRSYGSARPPSYYVFRKYMTSRSHTPSMFDVRGPRLIPKLRILRLGETRTPPTNDSARYGLSRSTLERDSYRE